MYNSTVVKVKEWRTYLLGLPLLLRILHLHPSKVFIYVCVCMFLYIHIYTYVYVYIYGLIIWVTVDYILLLQFRTSVSQNASQACSSMIKCLYNIFNAIYTLVSSTKGAKIQVLPGFKKKIWFSFHFLWEFSSLCSVWIPFPFSTAFSGTDDYLAMLQLLAL